MICILVTVISFSQGTGQRIAWAEETGAKTQKLCLEGTLLYTYWFKWYFVDTSTHQQLKKNPSNEHIF